MPFQAVRLECPSCGNAFVVGGGRWNDLAQWSECEVECPHCRMRSVPANGRTVALAPAIVRKPVAPARPPAVVP